VEHQQARRVTANVQRKSSSENGGAVSNTSPWRIEGTAGDVAGVVKWKDAEKSRQSNVICTLQPAPGKSCSTFYPRERGSLGRPMLAVVSDRTGLGADVSFHVHLHVN
jgi:hypothetical protein